ncbi:MAG: RidA family protein [Rhodospirillales bacterium]|jgi:enamine deaminase RidA (YjgF/YER057c/UK114 family)
MDILQPPNWPKPKGYSNGIAAKGTMVFVAGMVGWNEKEEFETNDFAEQAHQALKNIVAVLTEAGARPEHITRMTWYFIDKDEYNASLRNLGQAYQSVLGKVFPAMTGIQVAGLVENEAKVEIEVTAVIPD